MFSRCLRAPAIDGPLRTAGYPVYQICLMFPDNSADLKRSQTKTHYMTASEIRQSFAISNNRAVHRCIWKYNKLISKWNE